MPDEGTPNDVLSSRVDELEKKINQNEKKTGRLETFKAISTFLSSVVIAIAGVWVTYLYNSRQLKVTQTQNAAQLELTREQTSAQIEISRNKELATILPNLASSDAKTRQVAAISLSLFGKDAVKPLIAALDDSDTHVTNSIVDSLIAIGDSSEPQLIEAVKNEATPPNVKCNAIYTLGLLRNPEVRNLALPILNDSMYTWNERGCAAIALGYMQDRGAINDLMEVLRRFKESNTWLLECVIWALGKIGDPIVEPEIKSLLQHPDEHIRYRAVYAFKVLAKDRSVETLSKIEKTDKSEMVRQAAGEGVLELKPAPSLVADPAKR